MNNHKLMAISLGLVFVAVAFMPLATATHMSTYYLHEDDTPMHQGMGTWNEDGQVVPSDAPVGLAGLTERVRATVGATAGDGSIVLNAHTAWGANPMENLNFYAGTNFLYPGATTFMAWYGAWNDLNGDGIIDEYPPSNLAKAALDEFAWEGLESGRSGANSAVMNGWILPSHIESAGFLAGRPDRLGTGTPEDTLGAWSDVESTPDFPYTDRTGPSEAQPFYVNQAGWSVQTTDEGFIMTTTILSVVEAKRAAGSDIGYDLTVAAAYRDVDIYQSVDPTVEALYLSVIRGVARPTYDGALNTVNDTINLADAVLNETLSPVFDIVDPVLDPIVDAIEEQLPDTSDQDAIIRDAEQAQDDNTWGWFPNERARSMAGNDYASGYNGWVDAWTRSIVPTVANVDFSQKHPLLFAGVYGENVLGPFSPTQGLSDERRQMGAIINVFASAGAWHDVNGDGWIGEPTNCGTPTDDPDNFDGDGYCKDRAAHDNGLVDNPHQYGSSEFVGLASALCGLSAEITPADGGIWPPGSGILMTADRPTQRIDRGQDYYVPLLGTEKAFLRFDTQCSTGTGSRTIDALFMPSGSFGTNLNLKVTVELPAIDDETSGVEFLGGIFTDEDHIVGAL